MNKNECRKFLFTVNVMKVRKQASFDQWQKTVIYRCSSSCIGWIRWAHVSVDSQMLAKSITKYSRTPITAPIRTSLTWCLPSIIRDIHKMADHSITAHCQAELSSKCANMKHVTIVARLEWPLGNENTSTDQTIWSVPFCAGRWRWTKPLTMLTTTTSMIRAEIHTQWWLITSTLHRRTSLWLKCFICWWRWEISIFANDDDNGLKIAKAKVIY